jgi:hypothetical protein
MSSIWREVADNRWTALPIGDGAGGLAIHGIRFVRFARGADRAHALLAMPETTVWVNGQPVLGGLRVLDHKDEVLLGTTRLFFSAESTPVAATYSPTLGTRTPTCPVCRGPVRAGERAVQCPGCSRWFHQFDAVEAKQCWTYAATCRFCSHPTALTGEAAWRPEMEDRHV